MNWYLIAYDIFTSESGWPPSYPQEQQQILDYLTGLATRFADSIPDFELDNGDLLSLGLCKIRDKIETFEPRSDDDNKVTKAFKTWMSKVCRNLWIDEYNKIKRKIDYESKNYSPGEYDEHADSMEIVDPVDMDILVINAEYKSLMRCIIRDVLEKYTEHRREAVLVYRSTRKGRKGTRGLKEKRRVLHLAPTLTSQRSANGPADLKKNALADMNRRNGMSKVTNLRPKRSENSDLFDEVLGEVAVETGFKLPETEAELEIYERQVKKEAIQHKSGYKSIHEALADAEKVKEVRYRKRKQENINGTFDMASRNGDEINADTLRMMDAAADEDDD